MDPLSRLDLRFDEPALEREWWGWFASERARVVRGGVAVLVAGMVGFSVFDAALFPTLYRSLLVVRIATLCLMAPALYALFGGAAARRSAEHGQEWLLWICGATFAGLGAIAWIIGPLLGDTRGYASILALCLVLAGLYGGTGLRVRYAALLGVSMTVAFAVVVVVRAATPPGFFFALGMFGVGINLVGLPVSWSMEQYGRRAFLRARELEAERSRADELLLNVMPRLWADRVGAGVGPFVERRADATVIFATVTGFEAATGTLPLLDGVELLDRLVGTFDELALAEGVERIKTIGATYMAAAGVTDSAADHAERAARLAVRMREAVRVLAGAEALDLALRVGIASGPLVVGVIGRSRFAFDCWGDTVNTAARLDGSGAPDRLHATAACAARLGAPFFAVERGLTELKGKGPVATAWVEVA